MMSAVHAILGAAAGSLSSRRSLALLAGVGTHLVGDLLPHRDYGAATELPLVAAALWWVGARRGWNSPAFWGAVGGAVPDIENAIERLGLYDGAGPAFPTHSRWHGKRSEEIASQGALALLCWALLRRAEPLTRAKQDP
jgi:hypothetical protein